MLLREQHTSASCYPSCSCTCRCAHIFRAFEHRLMIASAGGERSTKSASVGKGWSPCPWDKLWPAPVQVCRGFDKPASPDSSRAHPQWYCPLPTCTAPACCAHNVCQQLYWEQAPWTRPVEQDRFLRTTKSRLSECCPQQWSSNRANPALWGGSQMLTNTYMYIQTHSCALHTLKKLPAIICNWE